MRAPLYLPASSSPTPRKGRDGSLLASSATGARRDPRRRSRRWGSNRPAAVWARGQREVREFTKPGEHCCRISGVDLADPLRRDAIRRVIAAGPVVEHQLLARRAERVLA